MVGIEFRRALDDDEVGHRRLGDERRGGGGDRLPRGGIAVKENHRRDGVRIRVRVRFRPGAAFLGLKRRFFLVGEEDWIGHCAERREEERETTNFDFGLKMSG